MEDISRVGERALLRSFGGPPIEANARARALARRLTGSLGVEDVVPGARTVLVSFTSGDHVSLDLLRGEVEPGEETGGALHEIPVVYDGPDLSDVARAHDLDVAEVIRIHSQPDYVVAFMGFSPGFPYLLGLPEDLHTPRLATPRTRIPAGSVGIGGEFTGIYPQPTPGGWRLIGRTDVALFDAAREPPAVLGPGDRVRFVEA